MKRTTLLIFLIYLVSTTLVASPDSDIVKANTAYQAGFYENAIALYEKVIKEGFTSSELYYNLGNAYFKANNNPSAILNYERALKLDPGNEDLIYNLKVANNQIIDKIDQLPKLFYERWWLSLKQLNSTDGWAKLTIILCVVLFLLVAIFLLSTSIKLRRILLPTFLVVLFLMATSFIIAYETYSDAIKQKEAIVFEATLAVKSSPEDSGIDLFVIHEGLKVEVIDELTGWREIKIANGSKGWVKSQTIVPI
jgi:tetratricopeptide (TPR) repeat protein